MAKAAKAAAAASYPAIEAGIVAEIDKALEEKAGLEEELATLNVRQGTIHRRLEAIAKLVNSARQHIPGVEDKLFERECKDGCHPLTERIVNALKRDPNPHWWSRQRIRQEVVRGGYKASKLDDSRQLEIALARLVEDGTLLAENVTEKRGSESAKTAPKIVTKWMLAERSPKPEGKTA